MDRFCLEDIFFGYSDGKQEALHRDGFENYFYDYENIIDKASQNTTYLILGRKGTGKSLLGEYLVKTSDKMSNYSEIVSFKEFKFQQLRILKTDDVSPNEYMSIWTWILLIESAKVILKNTNLEHQDQYIRLRKFINSGYRSLLLSGYGDPKKLNNVQGDFLIYDSQESVTSEYHNFISDLEKIIVDLLILSLDKQYTLILDEIDDRFVNDDTYKNALISLIKSVSRLNIIFQRKKIKFKILLLLRTDIFVLLNDTDLNKIKMDNSIILNWGRRADYTSPLFDVIIKKIKTSIPHITKYSKEDILYRLFPDTINGFDTGRFLSERTLFRPRDLIIYLNIAKNKSPKDGFFTENSIKMSEREYSEYFYDEIRNEMKGHISEELFVKSINLLKATGRFFYINEIENMNRNKKIIEPELLMPILDTLFTFSVIGNRRVNNSGGYFYSWKYREDRAEIDYDSEFVVHLGLRPALMI